MTPDSQLVPDVRRIAVLRANALGDFVFAQPALDALRAAYPDAEIVLLARDWHERFLAGRPSPVDRVVALPAGILPDGTPPLAPHAERAFLDGLAQQGWDIALQMHGGGRHSNPLVRALDARVAAGCVTADAAPLDRSIRYVYHQSELARLLEVVGLVGAPPVRLDPHIAVTARDREAAAAAAPDLARERPYAVLHPGATDARRRWPPERFAGVGDALAALGLSVAITGVAEERPVADAVSSAMTAPLVDLVGRLGLDALVGVLADAALVVANDTGPLHLAAAVGAPTVGIYWIGNAINGGTPLRDRHRLALSWRTSCPACGADCTRSARCPHDDSFVADVPVEEVLDAALDLLSPARPVRRPPAPAPAALVTAR